MPADSYFQFPLLIFNPHPFHVHPFSHHITLTDDRTKFNPNTNSLIYQQTVALDLHTISDEHMRIWNLVHASQRVALHAARNETRTGTVDEHAREVMRLGGYDKYFTHRLGHGKLFLNQWLGVVLIIQ